MGQEIHPMFAQYKPNHDLPDYPHNMGKMIFVTYLKITLFYKKLHLTPVCLNKQTIPSPEEARGNHKNNFVTLPSTCLNL